MKIIRSINKLRKAISNVSNLGFVPTMGGIHNGHLSLINKSINMCNKTLTSIYINPNQFNNKKDFLKYPRNIKRDLLILKKRKIDYVFIPKTYEIYKKKRSKILKIHTKKNVLCGKFRKGHFEGVIDIVDRFLNIINPKYMFLGEKDFQQLFLIKNYVKKKFRVKIVPCKTIRDKNQIALSSRNYLLSKKDLSIASHVVKKLKLFKIKLKNNPNYKVRINNIKKYLIDNFKIKLDYLELRNEKDLKIFKKKKEIQIICCLSH